MSVDLPTPPPKRRVGRPFEPGKSGNPAGPPKGYTRQSTKIAQLLDENHLLQAKQVMEDSMKQGNLHAAKFVLERLIPPARALPFTVDLPPIDSPEGLAAAQQKLISEVAAGRMRLDEADGLSGMLERLRLAQHNVQLGRKLNDLLKKVR